MQSVYNRIIVKIDKKFQDEIKTDSGLTFYQDVTFNPEETSTIEGEVISVPLKVDRDFVGPDFVHNVRVGDILYFHFNVVLDNDNRLVHDGEFWMVDYFNAIAILRDGKLIPVGEYILLEPVVEEVTSSLIIIPEMSKSKETNRAVVVGSNDPDIPEGCTVEYEPVGKFKNKLNGRELYCAFNSNVIYKL